MLRIILPALLVAPLPVMAKDTRYLGTWAEKIANCNLQSGSDSPMQINRKTIRGWEYNCDIKKVSGGNGSWSMKLSCASEGEETAETMQFTLSEGRLHETGTWGSRDYVKCPR